MNWLYIINIYAIMFSIKNFQTESWRQPMMGSDSQDLPDWNFSISGHWKLPSALGKQTGFSQLTVVCSFQTIKSDDKVSVIQYKFMNKNIQEILSRFLPAELPGIFINRDTAF